MSDDCQYALMFETGRQDIFLNNNVGPAVGAAEESAREVATPRLTKSSRIRNLSASAAVGSSRPERDAGGTRAGAFRRSWNGSWKAGTGRAAAPSSCTGCRLLEISACEPVIDDAGARGRTAWRRPL
jgi:hypothetical protein